MENVKKNKRQYSGFEKKEHQQGYLFLTPAIIILTIFIGLSVFYVVYLSFHKVNLFTKEYTFVGLQNYKRVLTDHIARIGLMNTLKFSLVVVPVQTVLALIISSVLNSNIKGKYFFRTVYFLPTLTSSSALTLIFMFMFNVSGPINKLLIDANLVSRGINFLQ